MPLLPIYPATVRWHLNRGTAYRLYLTGCYCEYAVAYSVMLTWRGCPMTLMRMQGFTMAALIGLVVQAQAQAPCPELARLRSEAAETWKRVNAAPTSIRCGLYHRVASATKAVVEYANNNPESCAVSGPLLKEMTRDYRWAVQFRDNVCAGRPSIPFPADIRPRR